SPRSAPGRRRAAEPSPPRVRIRTRRRPRLAGVGGMMRTLRPLTEESLMFAIGSDVRARGATLVIGLGLSLLAASCGRPLAPGELPRGDASAADASLDVRIPPPPPD